MLAWALGSRGRNPPESNAHRPPSRSGAPPAMWLQAQERKQSSRQPKDSPEDLAEATKVFEDF